MPLANIPDRMPYSQPLFGWQFVNQLFLMVQQPQKEQWLVTSARLNATSVRQRLIGGKNFITSQTSNNYFSEPVTRLAHQTSTHKHSEAGVELRRRQPYFKQIAASYQPSAFPEYWQLADAVYKLANNTNDIRAVTLEHRLDEPQREAFTQLITFLPILTPSVVTADTIFARTL